MEPGIPSVTVSMCQTKIECNIQHNLNPSPTSVRYHHCAHEPTLKDSPRVRACLPSACMLQDLLNCVAVCCTDITISAVYCLGCVIPVVPAIMSKLGVPAGFSSKSNYIFLVLRSENFRASIAGRSLSFRHITSLQYCKPFTIAQTYHFTSMNQPAAQPQPLAQPQSADDEPVTDLAVGPQPLLSPRLSNPPIPVPGVIRLPPHIILRTKLYWTTTQIARLQVLIPPLDVSFAHAFPALSDAAIFSATLLHCKTDLAILQQFRGWLVTRLPERHLPELPELFSQDDPVTPFMRPGTTFLEDALDPSAELKLLALEQIFTTPETDVWEDHGTYQPERPNSSLARKRVSMLYLLGLVNLEQCEFDLARQMLRHVVSEAVALSPLDHFKIAQFEARYYIGVTLFHEDQFMAAWEVFRSLRAFMHANNNRLAEPRWCYLVVDIGLMSVMTLVKRGRRSEALKDLRNQWTLARAFLTFSDDDARFGRILAWSLAGGNSPVRKDMWKIRER